MISKSSLFWEVITMITMIDLKKIKIHVLGQVKESEKAMWKTSEVAFGIILLPHNLSDKQGDLWGTLYHEESNDL